MQTKASGVAAATMAPMNFAQLEKLAREQPAEGPRGLDLLVNGQYDRWQAARQAEAAAEEDLRRHRAERPGSKEHRASGASADRLEDAQVARAQTAEQLESARRAGLKAIAPAIQSEFTAEARAVAMALDAAILAAHRLLAVEGVSQQFFTTGHIGTRHHVLQGYANIAEPMLANLEHWMAVLAAAIKDGAK